MMKIINIIVLFLLPQFSYPQHTIEGHVYNKQNIAIPYTSIYDQISGRGTYSDINGYFTLKVEKLPLTLKFSNVGYKSKEVETLKKKELKIILEEKTIELGEVVVHSDKIESKYIGSPKKIKGSLYMAVENAFDQIGLIVNNQ